MAMGRQHCAPTPDEDVQVQRMFATAPIRSAGRTCWAAAPMGYTTEGDSTQKRRRCQRPARGTWARPHLRLHFTQPILVAVALCRALPQRRAHLPGCAAILKERGASPAGGRPGLTPWAELRMPPCAARRACPGPVSSPPRAQSQPVPGLLEAVHRHCPNASLKRAPASGPDNRNRNYSGEVSSVQTSWMRARSGRSTMAPAGVTQSRTMVSSKTRPR